MRPLVLLLVVSACTSSGTDRRYSPGKNHTLGLNDITMLLPLPASPDEPTLLRLDGTDTSGEALVPQALFTRLVTDPGDVVDAPEAFHLVAVRFDLCDRQVVGPCDADADGSLRLVFQPLFPTDDGAKANDVAVHAFYPIPSGELPDVVRTLRALGQLQGERNTSPLAVSPALSAGDDAYRTELRDLVGTYARADRLVRFTLFAQNAFLSSIHWAFRGVEAQDGGFVDIVIPGIGVTSQELTLVGIDSFEVTPLAAVPAGLVFSETSFAEASLSSQRAALEDLAAVDNPDAHTAVTVQCVACHTSTLLMAHRSALIGADPASLDSAYQAGFDLSPTLPSNNRVLRGLGWFLAEPSISQRVANETAHVLLELEARFPD